MASFVSPTIVNVGYRSTNFWVVSAGRNRLLVDLGWPGMAGALFANLERMGVPLDELQAIRMTASVSCSTPVSPSPAT